MKQTSISFGQNYTFYTSQSDKSDIFSVEPLNLRVLLTLVPQKSNKIFIKDLIFESENGKKFIESQSLTCFSNIYAHIVYQE